MHIDTHTDIHITMLQTQCPLYVLFGFALNGTHTQTHELYIHVHTHMSHIHTACTCTHAQKQSLWLLY